MYIFRQLFYWMCLGMLGLSACEGQSQGLLPAKDFQQKIKATAGVQLLDVRSPDEFAQGYIPGAKNINYSSLDFRAQVAKLDKKRPVLVYCLSGIRSARAVSILREMGFQVQDLAGGFRAWASQGLPIEKP